MPDLTINFGDPESMLAAIPEIAEAVRRAEQCVEEADRELLAASENRRRAQTELDRARELGAFLQNTLDRLEGPRGADVRPNALDHLPELAEDASSKDVALRVVTLINGPASMADVAQHMPEFSTKTVSWALWKLADDGAIQKLKHGIYAPLDYVEGQPTTNYYEAARLGMPVPSARQVATTIEDTITRALERDGEP
jgi:hypothetical protein